MHPAIVVIGSSEVEFIRVDAHGGPCGPAGPWGPVGPCAPFAPLVPFVPSVPARPGAPEGPGTATDRTSARIAITIATTLNNVPVRPPCPGIPMGGAGIDIGCGGAGSPPPYEGCMRVIGSAGK